MDKIILNKLSVRAPLGAFQWPKPGSEELSQPLVISAAAPLSVELAASSDSLPNSVNYGTLAKLIERVVAGILPGGEINSLETLGYALCTDCLKTFPNLDEINIEVEKPRAHLYAKGAGIKMTAQRGDVTCGDVAKIAASRFYIRDLEFFTVIGINPGS
ncbi:uncharacterized protein EI90DRAFT_3137001, partial [Cantharellus anzutake]|uniref:uncharacterized protein n=1 Tax=Cantharellus anzutake TaxID=1750568 RepID=UPI001902C3E0